MSLLFECLLLPPPLSLLLTSSENDGHLLSIYLCQTILDPTTFFCPFQPREWERGGRPPSSFHTKPKRKRDRAPPPNPKPKKGGEGGEEDGSTIVWRRRRESSVRVRVPFFGTVFSHATRQPGNPKAEEMGGGRLEGRENWGAVFVAWASVVIATKWLPAARRGER